MNDWAMAALALLFLLANAYFVVAEYSLVSSRPGKLESEANAKVPFAASALGAVKNLNRYVALVQICITALGIAVGSFIEPWLSSKLAAVFPPGTPEGLLSVVSIIIAAYPLVVIGELLPKYYALSNPEARARATIGPLRLFEVLLRPLTWLFQAGGQGLVKLLRLKTEEGPTISADEIFFMVRSGRGEGGIEDTQATLLTKTLKLDKLDAEDAMIHRLDVKWLDANLGLTETLEQLKEISHSRVPIANGDIDEIVGIVYLQDIIKYMDDPDFSLISIARPPVFVPETVTLDRLIGIMKENKSQIVIVQDEYGGTSGIVTLEDIAEELFGDLEDALEYERDPIEWRSTTMLTARADVRYDELLEFMKAEHDVDDPFTTEPLAAIIQDQLERLPKIGDSVDTAIGRIRVEQMTQRRIIRVGITAAEGHTRPSED